MSESLLTLNPFYRKAICYFCAFPDSNVTIFGYEGTGFPK
jgi:hypothetical protein